LPKVLQVIRAAPPKTNVPVKGGNKTAANATTVQKAPNNINKGP